MRKSIVVALMMSCLFVFLAGCNKDDTEAGGLTKITFTEPSRILSLAPFYVAIEQGFFEEEGIEANIASGGGGAQVIATLLSGEAQFAISGPRSMFSALEADKKLLAIQSLNSALTFEIAVADEYLEEKGVLPDSPLEDRVAVLNGAKIGTNLVGDSGDVYMRYLMQLHGQDPLSVETVKLSGVGPKIGGMKEGIVDGGINSAPFSLQAKDQEVGSLLLKASEEPKYANMVWEVVFAEEKYLEENPELTEKVVRAIGKGIEFARKEPKKTAESIISYFDGIEVEVLEDSLIGMVDTFQGYGEMNQEAWDNAQDPLIEFSGMSGVKTKHDTAPGVIWTNDYVEKVFSGK